MYYCVQDKLNDKVCQETLLVKLFLTDFVSQ